MKETNLKEVEKKTYMSYHQDGLIDILVGIYVLMFGSGILLLTFTDFSTWFVVIPAICMHVYCDYDTCLDFS